MNYLAKSGATFGPFTDEQIAGMRTRGQLAAYTWIWEGGATKWEALDPAPPAPSSVASAASVAEGPEHRQTEPPAFRAKTKAESKPVMQERAETPKPPKKVSDKRIEAVLHDFQQVINGTLQAMTEAGCELISTARDGLNRRGPVMLSLLDPGTGRSVNVRAQLTETFRRDGQWAYQLQWDKCPEIVRS